MSINVNHVTNDISASSGSVTINGNVPGMPSGGATGNILVWASSGAAAWGAPSTGIIQDGSIKSGNFNADANTSYFTLGAITITLPAAPSTNDMVGIKPVDGGVGAVIARNGLTIMGLAEDLTIDTANIVVNLQYVNSTYGWRIV